MRSNRLLRGCTLVQFFPLFCKHIFAKIDNTKWVQALNLAQKIDISKRENKISRTFESLINHMSVCWNKYRPDGSTLKTVN